MASPTALSSCTTVERLLGWFPAGSFVNAACQPRRVSVCEPGAMARGCPSQVPLKTGEENFPQFLLCNAGMMEMMFLLVSTA